MKWPWRRRDPEEDKLREDRERLAAVESQWSEVHEAAATMRVHKRRNHFAQSIATIYRSEP